ncbi:MBL fold metallo-hydrolase [Desulfurispira natronophila]|uniref:Phosphoribosyl 1,2-cyclic phosphodiesterase n=1 Tax=Desulfurispira natronophila TaxID=682562 RepID=A0A7W8DGX4_9BACT|nr:MBL fold metallo-hydrolase [Desulfurispira natronophila]MBB5021809.1 phosphoribosyl 1,2-cyclic phosphodiesterase [Desulfurispira natronophila]
MRITILASGSKGNCALVETDRTRLLIDAGLNGKSIAQRLESIGVGADHIDAILLSHEHTDHTRGAGVFSRRHRVPVFTTELTASQCHRVTGEFYQLKAVGNNASFSVGDIGVELFSVSHDAVDPVGFYLSSCANRHLCYATDTGMYTSLIREYAQRSHALVMESNHDEVMLMEGSYPWSLKQRVRSRMGHASNREASRFLQEVWWEGLETVFLAHLSEENNALSLAYSESQRVLLEIDARSTRLYGTRQHQVGSTVAV